MTVAINSLSRPSFSTPLFDIGRTSARRHHGRGDTFRRLAAGRAARGEAATSADDARLLQSAAGKIEKIVVALSAGADLTDALGLILANRAVQASSRRQATRSRIENALDKAQAQTKLELKQIQKRMDEENSSGFWDSFAKVFEGIAAAVGAVAGALSGNGFLIAGSALALGSLATSFAKGKVAPWVSFGLGLGAAGLGLTGAFVKAPLFAKVAAEGLKAGLTAGGAVAGGNATISRLASGAHMARSQDAAADAQEAAAAAEDFRREAADERELFRTIVATERRAVELVMGALDLNDRAQRAAINAENRGA